MNTPSTPSEQDSPRLFSYLEKNPTVNITPGLVLPNSRTALKKSPHEVFISIKNDEDFYYFFSSLFAAVLNHRAIDIGMHPLFKDEEVVFNCSLSDIQFEDLSVEIQQRMHIFYGKKGLQEIFKNRSIQEFLEQSSSPSYLDTKFMNHILLKSPLLLDISPLIKQSRKILGEFRRKISDFPVLNETSIQEKDIFNRSIEVILKHDIFSGSPQTMYPLNGSLLRRIMIYLWVCAYFENPRLFIGQWVKREKSKNLPNSTPVQNSTASRCSGVVTKTKQRIDPGLNKRWIKKEEGPSSPKLNQEESKELSHSPSQGLLLACYLQLCEVRDALPPNLSNTNYKGEGEGDGTFLHETFRPFLHFIIKKLDSGEKVPLRYDAWFAEFTTSIGTSPSYRIGSDLNSLKVISSQLPDITDPQEIVTQLEFIFSKFREKNPLLLIRQALKAIHDSGK